MRLNVAQHSIHKETCERITRIAKERKLEKNKKETSTVPVACPSGVNEKLIS